MVKFVGNCIVLHVEPCVIVSCVKNKTVCHGKSVCRIVSRNIPSVTQRDAYCGVVNNFFFIIIACVAGN